MRETLTLTMGMLLGVCILAEIAREVSFKRAALQAQRNAFYARALAVHPLIWVGIALWAIEVVSWILVLEHAPLSLAYPIMTLVYAGVPIAGAWFLRERLSRVQLAGAALVAAGVVIVSVSGA